MDVSSGCWGASRAVLGGFRDLMQSSRVRPSGLPVGVALKCVAWSAGVAIVASGAGSARAVDGTWVGAGSEWTTGSNWSSAPVVPDGTATFTNNGAPTAVTISNSTSIGTMEFTTAAPAYSFTVTNSASFAINSAVTSTSPTLPNFAVNAGATLTAGDGANVTIGTLSNGASGGGTVVVGPTDPARLPEHQPCHQHDLLRFVLGGGLHRALQHLVDAYPHRRQQRRQHRHDRRRSHAVQLLRWRAHHQRRLAHRERL